ncbi:MAG TPA: hypothetical protein VN815_08985 [Steroidobacteraceae bacterium]|nr:hypothetical protein [Steroidobacteraceae bacterium]
MALAAAMFSIPSWMNPVRAADGPKPLFASNEMLSLTLTGPLETISRDKGAKPISGVLRVGGAAPETLPVTLSVRGITRRKKEVCAFPPLRVEFTEKPGPSSIFKGQKHLKLVTQCQRMADYQQYLLLEYTAYRLYRDLTPDSFNVRLAKIDYAFKDGHAPNTRLGFFIEDIDDVAKRNGQERLRGVGRISASQLDAAAAARYAVFEYMISNLDWAMTAGPAGTDCCHNARLLGAEGVTGASTGLTPVPYDFDYAGLVNAPYAVPPAGIPVANVRVRRYRGFCAHNEEAKAFLAQTSGRRDSLMAILNETPQLEERTRRNAAGYLGDFFEEAGSPSKVADLMKACLR